MDTRNSFRETGFQKLASVAFFLYGAPIPEFNDREAFEALAAERHKDYLLQTRGVTLEEELQLHVQETQKKENRMLDASEVENMRSRILQQGLLQPDQKLLDECARLCGIDKGASLAQIARAFQKKKPQRISHGLAAPKKKSISHGCKMSHQTGQPNSDPAKSEHASSE